MQQPGHYLEFDINSTLLWIYILAVNHL